MRLSIAFTFAHTDSQRIALPDGVLKTIKRRIFPQEQKLEELQGGVQFWSQHRFPMQPKACGLVPLCLILQGATLR